MFLHFRPHVWFFIAAALYVILHAGAVFMPPVYDDWPVIEMSRVAFTQYGPIVGLWKVVSEPIDVFWRPLHILLTAPVFGESAVVTQLAKLAAVIAVAWLLVRLSLSTGMPHSVSFATGIALLLHQSMVWGGEIDRWGDVVLGGALIAVLLHGIQAARGTLSPRAYIVSVAGWTALAAAAKEAGVVLPAVPLIAGLVLSASSTERKRHVAAASASAAIVVLYLVARSAVGLGLGAANAPDEYYRFDPGLNVLKNVVLVGYALVSPINTIRVVIDGGWWLVAGGMFAAIWSGVVLWGLYGWTRNSGFRWVVVLLLLFVVVQGPSLLMKDISEQNIARSLPFGLLLAAMAVWQLWTSGGWKRRTGLGLLLTISLMLHAQATHSKVGHLVAAAERGRSFRAAVAAMMPEPPPRPVVFAAERTYHGYSVYVHPLWRSLPGDADSGMRLRYREPSYTGIVIRRNVSVVRYDQVDPDFVLTGDNLLVAADGRAIQIHPADPYVGRKLKR